MWTRKSSILAGAGVALLILSLVAKSYAALGIGAALLAFVLVTFLVFRREVPLAAARTLDLHRVFEGDTTTVAVSVENRGKRAVFLELRDELPREVKIEGGQHYAFLALHGGEKATVTYSLRTPLLGSYGVGPLGLRLEDPFGLFYEERRIGEVDTITVLPRVDDLRKAALLSKLPMPLLGEHQVNQPGDGFDFFALREYVPGDTMKTINWKATARSGKLMVNQMERVTSAEATIIYDNRAITKAGPEEFSARVVGARVVASFSDMLHKKKDIVRLVYYDEDVHELEPAPAERQIPAVLTLMAQLRPRGAFPLRLVVEEVLPELKPRTPVILVSPFLDDATAIEAVGVLLANEMVLTAVSPRPVRLPGVDPDLEKALLADRERTLRALRGYGVFTVDLEPGVSLAATLEKGGMMKA